MGFQSWGLWVCLMGSPSSVAGDWSGVFSSELHPVHPPVHLRPADLDGEPVHLRLRLLQRRPHRQVLQAVCTTEGAGAGGESSACRALLSTDEL